MLDNRWPCSLAIKEASDLVICDPQLLMCRPRVRTSGANIVQHPRQNMPNSPEESLKSVCAN